MSPINRPLLISYCSQANGNYNLAQSGSLPDWKANVAAWAAATGVQPDGYTCFCSTEYTNPPTAAGMAAAAYDYAQGFAWANANGVPLMAVLTAVELASAANGASSASNIAALQQTAAGAWDTYYQQVVQQFAAAGCKLLYVRVQWEHNGGWYVGWAGYQQAYQWTAWVAAFEHVAAVLHAAGTAAGITVKVIWNPDAIASSSCYVPGTLPTGMDLLGLDLYSSYIQWGSAQIGGPGTGTAAKEQAWDTAAGTSSGVITPAPTSGSYGWGVLDHIALAKSLGLPICICESGDGTGGAPFGFADDPDWPTYVASRLAQAVGDGVPVELWSIWIGPFDLTWFATATYPAAVQQVLALGSSNNTGGNDPMATLWHTAVSQSLTSPSTTLIVGDTTAFGAPTATAPALIGVNWNVYTCIGISGNTLTFATPVLQADGQWGNIVLPVVGSFS